MIPKIHQPHFGTCVHVPSQLWVGEVLSRTRDREQGRRVRANMVPGESWCCVSHVSQGTVTPQETRTGMQVSQRVALRLWV